MTKVHPSGQSSDLNHFCRLDCSAWRRIFSFPFYVMVYEEAFKSKVFLLYLSSSGEPLLPYKWGAAAVGTTSHSLCVPTSRRYRLTQFHNTPKRKPRNRPIWSAMFHRFYTLIYLRLFWGFELVTLALFINVLEYDFCYHQYCVIAWHKCTASSPAAP